MIAKDYAVAFALAAYSVQENAAPIVKVTETKQKLVASTKNKKPNAPKVEAPIVPSVSKVEKGSLEATGFLKMMRNAKDRNEKILAIGAFIGYDHCGDFGTQELAANSAARRALNPITAGKSREEVRSVQRSALGFVAGLPNGLRAKVQDLLAREKMAVDVMLSEQKLCDAAQNETTRTHHAGLALLEQERLDYIREELKNLI